MKILAINSCPRPDSRSKTGLLLSHLVNGMIMGGARVEKVTLRHKRVEICRWCFRCWTKTPGVCAHNDDMSDELYEKWLLSDIAVYATPLHPQIIHPYLSTFLGRTLPSVEPYLVLDGGRSYDPVRSRRTPNAVVLALSETPETEMFQAVSAYFRGLFGDQLLAEIFRADDGVLQHRGPERDGVLDAVESAGWELATYRRISRDTLDSIAGWASPAEGYRS